MKVGQWIKMILISSCVVTLVGCHARKNADQNAVNNANAAYNGQSETYGAGEETSFGDQAGGPGGKQTSQRIYYFDFDSNIVHSSDRAAIESNATYLLNHPQAKVLLEGHTDPRGSREYNIGLGERRARAVSEILTGRGVNPAQVRVVSYGAEKLAGLGRSEQDYQLDRRVVLVYMQR